MDLIPVSSQIYRRDAADGHGIFVLVVFTVECLICLLVVSQASKLAQAQQRTGVAYIVLDKKTAEPVPMAGTGKPVKGEKKVYFFFFLV